MPDDVPLWIVLISQLVGMVGSGGAGAWLAGRGASKEGDAAVTEAREVADAGLWSRLNAEIERLERQQEEEKRACNQQLEALREELDEERKARRELEDTVGMMVRRFEEISEPLPRGLE